MNNSAAIFLAGSLVLNAGLAVLLAVGAASHRPRAVTSSPQPARTAVAAGPVIDATVWPALSAGDLPSLVTRLREAGFPPSVMRAIISAQLQESFAARRKAVDPGADSRPFWKNVTLDPQVTLALRQLGREQHKAMRDLLGADAEPDDPMSRAQDARQFGHLSPDKQAEARRIVREFNDLRSDYFISYGGPITITQTDRDKLTALDKQMRAELAKVMTPREFEDYDLRGSNTANSLRNQLASFDTTEAEFRMLFQLQRAFDDRFPQMYSRPSQEEMRLRGEAQQQLNAQFKAALGPARAADYERSTNYEFRNTSQLVARLELPPETANSIWEVRDDIQKRVVQLRLDQSISPEHRSEQLAVLQKEALERVTPLLGSARGVEAYKSYGGQWIEGMNPRPRPAPPAPK